MLPCRTSACMKSPPGQRNMNCAFSRWFLMFGWGRQSCSNTAGDVTYLGESQDVGLSFKSPNFPSICCVGPERQKPELMDIHTAGKMQTCAMPQIHPVSFLNGRKKCSDAMLRHAADNAHARTCPPLCNKFAGTSGDRVHHVSSGMFRSVLASRPGRSSQ